MASAEGHVALRGLYAITPETMDTARLLLMVGEAIAGGARLVQYRAKNLARDVRLVQAGGLLRICRDSRIPFIVNDDVDLAVAIQADGVHLGRDDADPRDVRQRLPHAIIGVSCYDLPHLAALAAAAGADYVGVGSIFASPTKPGAVRAGLGALAQARQAGGVPVAAIGGITPDNAAHAIAAGADMIAVISALFDAPDVAKAARALSHPFEIPTSRHV